MSVFWIPPDLRSESHYVYAMFCRDGTGPGYIKFGRSKQIGRRLAGVRTSSPIPAKWIGTVEIGEDANKAADVEKSLLGVFADRRTTGEWFRFDYGNEADKAQFIAGCRLVFEHHSVREWWTMISVRALDEDARKRKMAHLHTMKRKARERAQREVAARRRAWDELAAYSQN